MLTESAQICGKLSIDENRRSLLDAYAAQPRTRSRHMLSFCNDVARYYRTLCIEYKAKLDVEEKSWSARNAKLRHCRKFWYFSTMLSVSAIASQEADEKAFVRRLLAELASPPAIRLADAANVLGVHATELLERYAFFISYMAEPTHREALEKVEFDKRDDLSTENPYPMIKLNLDLLHREMVRLIEQLPNHARDRIFDWFLL